MMKSDSVENIIIFINFSNPQAQKVIESQIASLEQENFLVAKIRSLKDFKLKDERKDIIFLYGLLAFKSIRDLVSHTSIKNYKEIDFSRIHEGTSLLELEVNRYISRKKGVKIGTYSAINGIVEVGVGSFLHSLHLPLRGTFLSFVQGFMLTLFGKELKGKGIIWIALISSGLKSFSPAGAKLKPMIFIFLQGLFYVLPSWVIGFNFLSVLLGYALLVLVNLFLPLLFDYILFGDSVIEAYSRGAEKVFSFISSENFGLIRFLLTISVIKLLISTVLSIIAYYFINDSFLKKRAIKLENLEDLGNDLSEMSPLKRQSWKEAFKGAFHDFLSRRFFLPFAFILFLIYFFTHLQGMAFITVLIRGALLSWFGFLFARRLDFEKIVNFLEDFHLNYVALALKKSAGILQTYIRKK